MISFETKTSAVYDILSQLKKLYGKRMIPADLFCEITLRDGIVTFASPGVQGLNIELFLVGFEPVINFI